MPLLKDVLLVFMVFVCAAQALHIWRLTKRRDEQDDCMGSVESDLREIVRKAEEKDREKQAEARRRSREGGR